MDTGRGRWVWVEATKELNFEREDGSIVGHQSKRNKPVASFPTTQAQPDESNPDRLVTLADVTKVAVGLLDTSSLQKMNKSSVAVFDQCYRNDMFKEFIWALLVYFDHFLIHKESSEDEALLIPGMLGEAARKAEKASRQSLKVATHNLGYRYSIVVSGTDMSFAHHSVQGKLKFSKTLTDRNLFEAIYEFAMLVTWVGFGYKHWDLIHTEIGRILRTPAFNKDLRVTKTEGNSESSKEHLASRIHNQRPPTGLLHQIRTPALCSILSSQEDASTKHFSILEMPHILTRGSIGQPLSLFNQKTLQPI